MRFKKRLFGCSAILLSTLFSIASCKEASHTYTCGLAEIKGTFDFHTDEQKAYLSGDFKNVPYEGYEEVSRPKPLRLEWSLLDENSSQGKAQEYTVSLSRDEGFSSPLTYHTQESFLDVYNLYLGATYYWKVSARFANGSECLSPVSSFSTASIGPRNLYVDGVTNCRDLGGWERSDGSHVKQGMLYRTARLNRSYIKKAKPEITSRGKEAMLEELGVRSEIDLRKNTSDYPENGGIASSVLGEEVNYYNVPMDFSDVGVYLKEENEAMKKVFSILSEKSNYPLFFHCHIGTDRTGFIAFLIDGLLGVSEEDLYRDYLFSNFASIGGSREVATIEEAYVSYIKSRSGNSLSEKIRNCLLEVGIPESQLEAIVSIMSE